MTSTHTWAGYIKVCAIILIVFGILDIINGLVLGPRLYWNSIFMGILYIIVGSKGVHAAERRYPRDSKQYLFGLVAILVMVLLVSVINFAVNMATICDRLKKEGKEYNCEHVKLEIVGYFTAAIASTLLCCACCVYPAWKFDKKVREEEIPPIITATEEGYYQVSSG